MKVCRRVTALQQQHVDAHPAARRRCKKASLESARGRRFDSFRISAGAQFYIAVIPTDMRRRHAPLSAAPRDGIELRATPAPPSSTTPLTHARRRPRSSRPATKASHRETAWASWRRDLALSSGGAESTASSAEYLDRVKFRPGPIASNFLEPSAGLERIRAGCCRVCGAARRRACSRGAVGTRTAAGVPGAARSPRR
jgi:hypothetical protein